MCSLPWLQGPWDEAHAAPVLHWCKIMDALHEVGCPPVQLGVQGWQAGRPVLAAGRTVVLKLPDWAAEALR